MRKNLIIIDGDYPYSTGEPFLENEIKYLGNHFENIYVFSYNGGFEDTPTRQVPKNVEYVPLGTLQTGRKYVHYALYSLFHFDKLPRGNTNGLKSVLFSLYQKGRSLYCFKQIKRYIAEAKIDMVNSVIYSYWLSDHALAAVRLKHYFMSKGIETKVYSRAHGFDVYADRNSAGIWPYQEYTIENTDRVYVCSENGKNYLRKKYPGIEEKIETAFLGTDDYGDKSDIIPQEKILVTCASLKKIKRTSMFAESFCKLIKSGVDVKWVCIGDGEELEEIKNIVNSYGCEKNVEFMGRTENSNVIKYYKSNDISYFCNVSLSEGLPVSIMEAMSFGIPCIATLTGGTGELVDNTNGRILDVNIDCDTLTSELKKELSISEEEYANKRKNARKSWKDKVCALDNYSAWCKMLADNSGENK